MAVSGREKVLTQRADSVDAGKATLPNGAKNDILANYPFFPLCFFVQRKGRAKAPCTWGLV